MILDDKYEPEERCQAMIDHRSGTLTALAGPGTGKTWGLCKRVRELTENRDVAAPSIVYVTFIREITRKFEEDLEEEYSDKALVPDVRVSTLHGLALGLLRNEGKAIGIVGHHEPLRVDAKRDIVALMLQKDIVAVLKDGGVSMGLRRVRAALGAAKAAWQKGIDEPKLSREEQAALDVYLGLSSTYQALDWDQVVIYANEICRRLAALPDWIVGMKHFLIDEYQDFNPSEQEFLRNISMHAQSVVITGDDDQSLYGGRGADPEAIVALHADPELDHVNLIYSWRCPSGILNHANCYLRWMRDDPRQLESLKEGGQVEIYHFESAESEADYLAKRLGGFVDSLEDEARPEDGIACLFPTRAVLERYARVFRDRGVPCTVPKIGQETTPEQLARVLLRLAHLRQQPLLERVVLSTFTSIKPRHVADVLEMLGRECATVANAVYMCGDRDKWEDDASSAAEEYCALIEALASQDPEQVTLCLESALGGSVEVTVERVQRFLEEADGDLEGAVSDFLRDVFRQPASADTARSHRPVELYTMVGAKGLTRRYVFLPGCEEMFLPRKAGGVDPDEEKRLFYVAVTRAKELVVITAPLRRAAGDPLCRGKVTRRGMSPFVPKLGLAIERMR